MHNAGFVAVEWRKDRNTVVGITILWFCGEMFGRFGNLKVDEHADILFSVFSGFLFSFLAFSKNEENPTNSSSVLFRAGVVYCFVVQVKFCFSPGKVGKGFDVCPRGNAGVTR